MQCFTLLLSFWSIWLNAKKKKCFFFLTLPWVWNSLDARFSKNYKQQYWSSFPNMVPKKTRRQQPESQTRRLKQSSTARCTDNTLHLLNYENHWSGWQTCPFVISTFGASGLFWSFNKITFTSVKAAATAILLRVCGPNCRLARRQSDEANLIAKKHSAEQQNTYHSVELAVLFKHSLTFDISVARCKGAQWIGGKL